MKDKFNLDSHKFHYHIDAINDFVQGKEAKPIYVEISPTAYCNHECTFCHYNYLGHKGRFEDNNRLYTLIDEVKSIGAKSVVFAGIGEPTLNKETIPAILHAKDLGLDVAMSTNGALLKEDDIKKLVETLTWIRFSFNATNKESYAKIHKTKESDFDLVLSNIEKMSNWKRKLNKNITIGVQLILIPENCEEIESLVKRLKSIGVDYFVVKHFYSHEKNEFKLEKTFPDKKVMNNLFELSVKYNSDKFNMIVRSPEILLEDRKYNKCYGLPYILYIREDGNLFSCFAYQHDEKFVLGNIFENSLQDIWESKKKKDAIDYINNCIDKNNCQPSCRHHQINNYLWDLKHPNDHINFI
ncbi:MAG: radical SAM protein [Halarcobacter sp.]